MSPSSRFAVRHYSNAALVFLFPPSHSSMQGVERLFQETHVPLCRIGGKCAGFRAKTVEVSGHLPVEGPHPAQGRRENTTGSGTKSMTPNYLMYMLEKPFEMEFLLTLIRHLLAFELTRFFLFPPPIYKIAMEEARWGAVYPETHRLVLKIEGNC